MSGDLSLQTPTAEIAAIPTLLREILVELAPSLGANRRPTRARQPRRPHQGNFSPPRRLPSSCEWIHRRSAPGA